MICLLSNCFFFQLLNHLISAHSITWRCCFLSFSVNTFKMLKQLRIIVLKCLVCVMDKRQGDTCWFSQCLSELWPAFCWAHISPEPISSSFESWAGAAGSVLAGLCWEFTQGWRNKLGKQQQLQTVTHTTHINHSSYTYHKHCIKL